MTFNKITGHKTSLPGNDRHHPFYFGIGDFTCMLVLDMVLVLDLVQTHLQESVFIMIFIDMTHPMIHGYVLTIFHLSWERCHSFSYNNKGYVLSGDGDDHGPLSSGEFWEYNPLTDNWTQC